MLVLCLHKLAWTVITFFGESMKGQWNKELNETEYVPIPRLPIKASYPWAQMHGIGYYGSFGFQVSIHFYGNSQLDISKLKQNYLILGLLFAIFNARLQPVGCYVLLMAHLCLRAIATLEGWKHSL